MSPLQPAEGPREADYTNRVSPLHWLGLAILVVQIVLFRIPWQPWYPWESIDPSWAYVLHHAWLQGLSFGNELVWSYGPLGFAYLDFYHPETYGWHLALRALLAGGFIWGAWWLAYTSLRRGIAACLWMTAIAVVIGRDTGAGLFSLQLLLLGVFYWLRDSKRGFRLLVVVPLLLVVSVSGLVKFTMLVSGTWVALLLTIAGLMQRSVFAWSLPVHLATVLIGWILVGQDLGDLGPYVSTSLDLSRGFGAVSQGFDVTELAMFGVASVLLVVSVLPSRAVPVTRRNALWCDPSAAALFLGFAGILFLAFKGGFVRQDAHATTGVVVVLEMCLIAVATTRGTRRWIGAAGLLVSLAAYQVSTAAHHGKSLVAHLGHRVTEMPDAARAMGRTLSGDVSSQQERYANRIGGILERVPLPPISGSVDVYPHSQGAIFAHGLTYRPRPVFQSQLAYTSGLVELNAESLRGTAAPDTVLFDVAPLGDFYPSLQDGAVWLELLTRYEPTARAEQFLVLERSQAQRGQALTELGRFEIDFGELVDLSQWQDPVIWAEIDVPMTTLGRLVDFVYRLPPVRIQIRTRAGKDLPYRLVRGIARSGFLLSPYLTETENFATLAAGSTKGLEPDRVESWSLDVPTSRFASWLYRTPVVNLSALALEARGHVPEAN